MRKLVAAFALVAVFVGLTTGWNVSQDAAYDPGSDPKVSENGTL